MKQFTKTNKITATDTTLIALFTALIAVCSWISIPLTIPFTLQTFAIFTTLNLLGGRRGTIAISVYILLGVVGIPVFSGFRGGIGALLGTTGGYILGFLLTALIYWLFTSLFGESFYIRLLSLIFGLVLCYFFGTIWYMFVYAKESGTIGMLTVLSWCVAPFVIPDFIKLGVSFLVSNRVSAFFKNKIN